MPSAILYLPFFLAAAAAASGGALFEADGAWYRALEAPAFSPPAWVFGPVWTVLYIMIAVAGGRLAARAADGPAAGRLAGFALGLWALQMTLNALWTPAFFGAHALGTALAIIAALWASIALLVLVSWRVERLAGLLLVPYLAWVSFAAALNFAYWQLN